MTCRICREALDCGDGVSEVTALPLMALVIPKRAARAASSSASSPCEARAGRGPRRDHPKLLSRLAPLNLERRLSSCRKSGRLESRPSGSWAGETSKDGPPLLNPLLDPMEEREESRSLMQPWRAADTATPTQSGDSEDSVAAVQDARSPTRFAHGSWSRCASHVGGRNLP